MSKKTSGGDLTFRFFRWSRRLFGSSGACSACGQAIPANEFVMRTGGGSNPATAAAPLQIFHIKCFMCSKCMAPLITGDRWVCTVVTMPRSRLKTLWRCRYYMLSGSLVCEQDWHKLLKSSAPPPAVRKGKVGRPRRSRDWKDFTIQNQRWCKYYCSFKLDIDNIPFMVIEVKIPSFSLKMWRLRDEIRW